MEEYQTIILNGVEYFLVPKNKTPKVPEDTEPLLGLWKIFEEPKLKKKK